MDISVAGLLLQTKRTILLQSQCALVYATKATTPYACLRLEWNETL